MLLFINKIKEREIKNKTILSFNERQKFLNFLQHNRKLRLNRNRSVLVSRTVIKTLQPLILRKFYISQLFNAQLGNYSVGRGWVIKLRKIINRFKRELRTFSDDFLKATDIPRDILKDELFELSSDIDIVENHPPLPPQKESELFKFSPMTRRKFTRFERKVAIALSKQREEKKAKKQRSKDEKIQSDESIRFAKERSVIKERQRLELAFILRKNIDDALKSKILSNEDFEKGRKLLHYRNTKRDVTRVEDSIKVIFQLEALLNTFQDEKDALNPIVEEMEEELRNRFLAEEQERRANNLPFIRSSENYENYKLLVKDQLKRVSELDFKISVVDEALNLEKAGEWKRLIASGKIDVNKLGVRSAEEEEMNKPYFERAKRLAGNNALIDWRRLTREQAYTLIDTGTYKEPVFFNNFFHYIILDFIKIRQTKDNGKNTSNSLKLVGSLQMFKRLLGWFSLFQKKLKWLKRYYHIFDIIGVKHFRQLIRRPLNYAFFKRLKLQISNINNNINDYYWPNLIPSNSTGNSIAAIRKRRREKKKHHPLIKARRVFFFLRWFYNIKRHEDFWRISKFLRARKTQLTVEQFMRFYELRLDLILYRTGFVPSLFAARVAINCAAVLVNGKIISNAAHGISNFDTIGFSSVIRFQLKVAFLKQLQRSTFRSIISLGRIKVNCFEYNYALFAFTFISRFFKPQRLPNLHFIFPRPQAFLYWGRTFYLSKRRDVWSLLNLRRKTY